MKKTLKEILIRATFGIPVVFLLVVGAAATIVAAAYVFIIIAVIVLLYVLGEYVREMFRKRK